MGLLEEGRLLLLAFHSLNQCMCIQEIIIT